MREQFDISQAGDMPRVVVAGAYHGDKTFPSLNNLLASFARSPQIGGSMKRKYKNICVNEIRDQLPNYKAQSPLIIHYRLFEPNRGQRRDVMNCVSMIDKCFEDALQDCGVIKDDSPRHVLNTTHDVFYTDENEPWFEVYLEEVSNED